MDKNSKRNEIEKEVIGVLCATFELDEKDVTSDKILYTDLDLDSFDAIDMAVVLSTSVGKNFDNEDLKKIKTVSDIVDAVISKLNEN